MLGSKYRFSVPQNHGLTSRECPHRCFRHDRTMTSPTSTEQKKRGGRPKQPKGTQRTHPVKVYFDDANYRKLLRIQRRDNTPLSTLVYNLAVNGYVKEPISRELTKYIRDLSGMANNLNQLAHLGHIHGGLAVAVENKRLAQSISEIIIKINEQL